MQTLSDKLSNIELKVRQLALKLERLQNENNNLKAELNKKDSKLSLIQEQVTKAQYALEKKQENDPEHSKKLRKDIEQYINEVDKCIEWLQKS